MSGIEYKQQVGQPHLQKQDLETLDITKLTQQSPEVIPRQATINVGAIDPTVVKPISSVNNVRLKNEMECNITIKLDEADKIEDKPIPNSWFNPIVRLHNMAQEELDSLTKGVDRKKNLREYLRKFKLERMKLKEKSRIRRRSNNNDDFRKIKKFKEFLECKQNGMFIENSGEDEFAILKYGSLLDNDIERDMYSETSSACGSDSIRPRRVSVAPQRFTAIKETAKKSINISTKNFEPDSFYEVEAIVNMNLVNTKVFFLVKWKNYSSKDNTWEPLENVRECDALEPFLDFERNGEEENIENMCQELLKEQQDELKVWSEKLKALVLKELRQFDPLEYKCYQLIYKIIKDQKPYYQNFRKLFKKMVALDYFHQLDVTQYEEHRKISREIMKKEMNVFTVSIVNNIDFELFPSFMYVKENLYPEGVIADGSGSEGCSCEKGCSRDSKCCPTNRKAIFAYKQDNTKERRKRLRLNNTQLIVECGKTCSCDDTCLNRVTQQPRKFPLQIFKTSDGRGWGLKAMNRIPKGSFIIEYTGEIVDQEESVKRGKVYDQIGKSYLFDLDYNEDAEAIYTIDAFKCGNLSRLINHSCEPNCKIWPVTTCSQDSSNIYKLCYFSTRLIKEGEEITFDYSGGSIEEKVNEDEELGTTGNTIGRRYKNTDECKCGANSCRGFIFA